VILPCHVLDFPGIQEKTLIARGRVMAAPLPCRNFVTGWTNVMLTLLCVNIPAAGQTKAVSSFPGVALSTHIVQLLGINAINANSETPIPVTAYRRAESASYRLLGSC
jgi:hypothetical protein